MCQDWPGGYSEYETEQEQYNGALMNIFKTRLNKKQIN